MGKHSFRLFIASSIILSIGTLLLSWDAIQNHATTDYGEIVSKPQIQWPANPKEMEKNLRKHSEFKNEPKNKERTTVVPAKLKAERSTNKDALPGSPAKQRTNSQIYQPDRYEDLQPEIMQAYAEGRVR